MLDEAVEPRDMNLPGWGLHELKGDLAGHWSVKVNGNWRMTFRFEADGCHRRELPGLSPGGNDGDEQLRSAHPGAVLRDVLVNVPMTISEFAAHIGVSRNTLSRILNERAASLQRCRWLREGFNQASPDIGFRMQNRYDFWHTKHAKRKKVRPIRMHRVA